jgi:hypothetical protein
LVLVDESAEEVVSVHAGQWRGRAVSSGGDGVWGLEVERAVRPSAVVVAHVDAEGVLKVATADDQ